jgi:WD40 repeat protein
MRRIAFSSDEKLLASYATFERQIRLWSIEERKQVAFAPGSTTAFAFSPDGARVAVAGRTITLWSLDFVAGH